MCETKKSKFLAGWIKGIILGTQLLFFQNLGLIDKLLLEHLEDYPTSLIPCDFSVSPSPFGLDYGTSDFGTWDSGLTKICMNKIIHLMSLLG